jgi:hypothetical protein
VCVQWRAEECRRFGLVPTSIYGGRHESVLATLWRTIARANWPLWVVERVVLFASPPTARTIGSYQATVWRHLWWGLCRRERAQAPTLKEVHKEQVGLATHHDCHTIGDESKSD